MKPSGTKNPRELAFYLIVIPRALPRQWLFRLHDGRKETAPICCHGSGPALGRCCHVVRCADATRKSYAGGYRPASGPVDRFGATCHLAGGRARAKASISPKVA